MKRIFALTLALSLLLYGCGKDEPIESTPDTQATQPSVTETAPVSESDIVTLYCLVKEDVYEGDFLIRRNTYEYDSSANLTKQETFLNSGESIWNEEYGVYQYVRIPADDIPEYIFRFSYDLAGNITEAQYEEYEDGELDFDVTESYSYSFNELGQLKSCDYTTTNFMHSPLQYDFAYENGRIVGVEVFTTRDGNPYGDAVQTYWFDYDDQGRLIREQICFSGSYQGTFTNQYTYDDQGRIASVAYTGNGQDGEYSSTQRFTHYDNQIVTVEIAETGEDQQELHYYNANQFLELDSQFSLFQKDAQGNVIVAQEMQDGIRREYTYQAIEVTRADAQRYCRRMHMLNAYPVEWDADYEFYYPVFFYHLIPNPIW